MKHRISSVQQRIIVYKINPNEQELNGEVSFDRNVDGRILFGNIFFCKNCIIVESEENEKIVGIFSLDHFYFLQDS